MPEYDYRVIAAPSKGVKAKGKKTPEDRFSHALEIRINEMAADGWEYQRAETLPAVERAGLTSTRTTWHNVLVFRRVKPVPVKEIPMLVPPIYENRSKTQPPDEQDPTAGDSHAQGSDTAAGHDSDPSDTQDDSGKDATADQKPSRGNPRPLVAQRKPPDAIS